MLQLFESKQKIEPSEVKVYMANILGFFMVQKELERQIPQVQDMNQLWIETGKMLETELDVLLWWIVLSHRKYSNLFKMCKTTLLLSPTFKSLLLS